MSMPKVLFFDIETIKTMFSGKYKLEAEHYAVLTFQYAWNDGPIKIISADQFPKDFKKNVFNDKRVLEEAAKVILEADFIVAHYGSRFDKPILRTRFLLNGLDDAARHIQRIKQIDTCILLRKLLTIKSSSLRYACELLKLPHKKDCGFEVWEAVRSGSLSAMKKLVAYAKGDIVSLRALYYYLRDKDPKHPAFNLFVRDSCPVCVSTWICIHAKPWIEGKNKYESKRCRKCGAHFRGKRIK